MNESCLFFFLPQQLSLFIYLQKATKVNLVPQKMVVFVTSLAAEVVLSECKGFLSSRV